ncbi:hypothetical protein MMC24_006940 [Lignoscripta atroalba]|nr:hypothetical protein [Lignoscripta atroalba]
MGSPSSKIVLPNAQSLADLFHTLPTQVSARLRGRLSHIEEIDLCNTIWPNLPPAIPHLLYTTLDENTRHAVDEAYGQFSPLGGSGSPSDASSDLWPSNPFGVAPYALFSPTQIDLQPVELLPELIEAEHTVMMKKGRQMQKTIQEEMNRTRTLWKAGDEEGGDNIAGWKLYAPDPAQIPILREFIRRGSFTTAGFAEGKYKDIFPRRVRLADNAVGILVEADITNTTCNTYWPLDFNTNGGVRGGPSARRTRFGPPSLDEHGKLQIFLNCSLHGEHDPTDPKILPTTTLFKNTTVVDSKSDTSSAMPTPTPTRTTKLVPNRVVDQPSLSKNTEHKGYLLASSSPLSTLSTTYKPVNQADTTEDGGMRLSPVLPSSPDQTDLTDDEEELARLSVEDNSVETNELVLLRNRVDQLETEALERARRADEKITFLTLAGACLDEVLMMQSQDAVKAGQFIKDLLNEPAIKTDKTLVNKITTWRNTYKTELVKHNLARNELRTTANHFPHTKTRLFSHNPLHQKELDSWALRKDLDRVYEEGDQWNKHAQLTEPTPQEAIQSIEEETPRKRIRTT